MGSVATSCRAFRFGLFEADAASNTATRGGVRIKIQDQPFRALLTLLDTSGEIVSREELRQKLWPNGTFVDFEGSLNVILKRLRASLDDDPDTLSSGSERKTRPQLCPREIPRRSSGEQGRGCGERQSQSDLSKSTPLPVKSAWKKTLAAQKREPLHQSLHRNR